MNVIKWELIKFSIIPDDATIMNIPRSPESGYIFSCLFSLDVKSAVPAAPNFFSLFF